MSTYVLYTPTTIATRAMFNFDAAGSQDFIATGTIRVSVSDAFSAADASTYGFYSGIYTASNETAWTPQMLGNVQEVLGIFSSFANISFSWVGDFDTDAIGGDSTPNPRDVGIAGVSDINISWIDRPDVDFSGISGVNDDGGFNYTGGAGDIFLNQASFADESLGLDTRARQVLMHELGHSVGLSHPHLGSGVTADFAATVNMGFSQLGFRILSGQDMNKEYFTVMSYDNQTYNAHTPMILDVIALQQAYGEGTGTTGAGNDTITAGTAGYRTYFDTGGIDTIDLSIYTSGASLRMGAQIIGADHLVGVAMNTADAAAASRGADPSALRWFYGEYENAIGSPGSDTLYDNALANSINGGAGNDSIVASGGNDSLFGGTGNDTLSGGAGIDYLVGGDGNDTLNGGTDFDFVDYSSATAGETVNLAAGTASGGAGSDTLFGLEYVAGSTYADVLIGSANRDLLSGGLGYDTLAGAGGDDDLNGGDGFDYADYGTSAGWVAVDLSAGVSGGTAGSDTLTVIESILGSQFNDALAGDANANWIEGRSGNDSLYGKAGNDGLVGADGNDQLDGGTGSDVLIGGADQDTFVLRAGDGGATLNLADVILDYTDGTDSMGLSGGLTFAELTISQGTGPNVADAIIQRTATGEYLAIVQNVSAATLDALDFKPVS